MIFCTNTHHNMKKKITRFILISLYIGGMLALNNSCVNKKAPKCVTYNEPDDNKPYDALPWGSVEDGINFSVGSIDKRYGKKSVPVVEQTSLWSGNAWKGERVNAQFVIWSSGPLLNTNCIISDLVNEDGDILNKENLKHFFVRYVMTDRYRKGKTADIDSSLVADALDPIHCFDIEANTTRPLWLTIDVPRDCAAGKYSGSITVNAHKQERKQVNIDLLVHERQLPQPKDWSFHLDLWQNPFAVARYNNVVLWSEEHFMLMKPSMEMLAGAGQKCITASIVHKPWGGQTYDYFESLVKWTKKVDGSWKYDYSIFDKWIGFAMECGITKQINCYSMIPWKNQFSYFDESLNKDTIVEAKPGTETYEGLWSPFLKQFVTHLKEKSWLDITTIAMDERSPEDMQKMIAFIKTVAPELKTALAGGYHEEINDDLYDLCVASAHIVPGNAIEERKEANHITTFYVCCNEPFPNTFTFSPPAESVYLGWYAAAKGYDGFLRWAYNSWGENPLVDSRFGSWPAGDTYFVYPGGVSSIRFERLREGIQDFEKIRILTEEYKYDGNHEAKTKLGRLDDFLKTFELSLLKDVPASGPVNRGKKIISDISGSTCPKPGL